MVARNYDYMAHGFYNSRPITDYSIEEERADWRDLIDTVKKHTGKQLKGRMGGGSGFTVGSIVQPLHTVNVLVNGSRPDLVVAEVLSPRDFDALEALAAAHPEIDYVLIGTELTSALLMRAMRAGVRPQPHEPPRAAIDLPVDRTVGDWVEKLTGEPVVEPVNEQATKWVAAFVDEGMAGWAMPSRERGLYHAWRTLAPRDFSGRLLGIEEFGRKVRALPEQPEDAILQMLRGLGVPEARWKEYLTRHLAQLPGWAGLIRWLGDNPDYPGQAGHPADVASYLALRLFYESELAGLACRRAWGIAGTVPALVLHCRNSEE